MINCPKCSGSTITSDTFGYSLITVDANTLEVIDTNYTEYTEKQSDLTEFYCVECEHEWGVLD
jgi:hypothetical protein